ncbi:MAG TPA: tyrosine--tRNA ligase [Chloroflexota bacterium]|nr:tyrosine--tRNA ligase [Chloroflexota bacterium]
MTTLTAPALRPPTQGRNAYDVLQERGLVYQCSDEEGLRRALAAGPVTVYAGFDPTADSLHIGHLVPVMALAHLQRAGHRPVALVGGGTAMIGDPTDKTSARRMMTPEEVAANARAVERQLSRFIDLSDDQGFMVDNAEWLLSLNYIEFIRDYGRYFSVNEMLRAETYRSRLETGLTFLEFNYMLLQAYDFLELYRRHRCTLQVGGSDQWSNVLAGADLIKKIEGTEAFALTCPLLTTASGEKMGKTASGGQVWLDPERTPPYDFYQIWINVEDADVERLLRLYTFVPLEEIRGITDAEGAALRPAKERLAFELTQLIHGEEAARKAQGSSRVLFGGASLEDIASAEDVPTVEVEPTRLDEGIQAIDLLVETGLTDSKSAARRLIDQGGAYLNEERLSSRPVTTADVRQGMLLLRSGKKRYVRVMAK